MELLYLWIDNYKNIHKQGFNFSPALYCEYDEKKNELILNEYDNYISDFFGKNINLTAIVGKNGSGKSSLLEFLGRGTESKEINSFIIYKKAEKYYCQYNIIEPKIIFNKEVKFIDKNTLEKQHYFYPSIINIAHSKKIGKEGLSHYYFGAYSGIYKGWDINRKNFYNMLEARFFVPRYINIATEYSRLFDKLKHMYKFDTLRLFLRNNTTSHLRKWIDKEIVDFRDKSKVETDLLTKVCIYEKNEPTMSLIREKIIAPIDEIEINLYDRNREKIVSTIEEIESIHRSQTYEKQVSKHNKYQEFDLAVLIAFIEHFLKITKPCESSESIYQKLLTLKNEIHKNAYISEHFFRINQSYILGFFEDLKNEGFEFNDNSRINIDEIIRTIKYFQGFKIHNFDSEGNPYIDISIDEKLKENLVHIRVMQKIFFEYDFDCGKEKYLRVFEYDLLNHHIGSSYASISDGEKHFIRFSIDILYYLEALKKHNFVPDKEGLALFLADEPDNAMHPIWKKKLIDSALEMFNNYSDIPNITVHFIVTTHSPFLLSDIPKHNIIFLDTYQIDDIEVKQKKQKVGNCKVVDGLKKKKETFGANIHTLLSDSFFMKDGLIGEFAREKIQSVIDFLNEDNEDKNNEKDILTEKKAWLIIQLIGEPFLKQKLETMFHDKFSTDEEKRKAKIQKLEKEIERLKNVKSKD